MKIETILNAMQAAYDDWCWNAEFISQKKYAKRLRQSHAFRARILEMDAESREAIAIYITTVKDLNIKLSDKLITIYELEAELKAKAWVDRPMRDPTERYELTNEEWSEEQP